MAYLLQANFYQTCMYILYSNSQKNVVYKEHSFTISACGRVIALSGASNAENNTKSLFNKPFWTIKVAQLVRIKCRCVNLSYRALHCYNQKIEAYLFNFQ